MDWHGLARIGTDWHGLANWTICVPRKNWHQIGTDWQIGKFVSEPKIDPRLAQDWHRIGSGLAPDWHLSGSQFAQDSLRIGTRLASDWPPIG